MGGWADDGNRCKPQGNLFTEKFVGLSQVYCEDYYQIYNKVVTGWMDSGLPLHLLSFILAQSRQPFTTCSQVPMWPYKQKFQVLTTARVLHEASLHSLSFARAIVYCFDSKWEPVHRERAEKHLHMPQNCSEKLGDARLFC